MKEKDKLTNETRDLSILIVDDDPLMQKVLKKILERSNFRYYIETVGNVNDSLDLITKTYWDTILLDLSLPMKDDEKPEKSHGLKLLEDLILKYKVAAPIVVITGSDEDELVDEVLDKGAYYFLSKPIRPKSLTAIIKNATSFQLSGFDGLTGLLNRVTFEERLKSEFERVKRKNIEIVKTLVKNSSLNTMLSHLSLIFIDVDNFKDINDTFNHLAGDMVLKTIGKSFVDESLYHVLKDEEYQFIIRPYDIASRFGGDEFAIFLPEATHDNAVAVAKRIADLLKKFKVSEIIGNEFKNDKIETVSLSLGVATYPDPNDVGDHMKLIGKADSAMYLSKQERLGYIFGYDENGKIVKK